MTLFRILACLIVWCSSSIWVPEPLSTACAQSKHTFSSDDYEGFVDDVVRLLAQGKEAEFRELLSPSLMKRSLKELGKEKVDLMIRQQFIGFFSDFHHLSANVVTTKTTDADEHRGLAVFRSFLNESGEERPFVVYVLEEDGKLVVGNILINKTLREVSELSSSKR